VALLKFVPFYPLKVRKQQKKSTNAIVPEVNVSPHKLLTGNYNAGITRLTSLHFIYEVEVRGWGTITNLNGPTKNL